jgi:hypothetical protein
MVSVLTLSEIDCGSSPYRVKFIFVGSLLSMQHSGHRAMTGWLGIRIMCPSGVTCLSVECCFSELAL